MTPQEEEAIKTIEFLHGKAADIRAQKKDITERFLDRPAGHIYSADTLAVWTKQIQQCEDEMAEVSISIRTITSIFPEAFSKAKLED